MPLRNIHPANVLIIPTIMLPARTIRRAHAKKQVMTQAAMTDILKTVLRSALITALITNANAIPATAMPTRRLRQPLTGMLPTAAATAAARPNTNAKTIPAPAS